MKKMIMLQHWESIAENEVQENQGTTKRQRACAKEDILPSVRDTDSHTAELQAISNVEDQKNNNNDEDMND